MVKVTIDGQEEGLLIVGGMRSGGQRNGVSEYHGKSGRWVQVATLPINVSSAQMAWNSDTKMMYHFGGFSGGQNSLKDGYFPFSCFENETYFQFTHYNILEMINGKILGERLGSYNWLEILVV